LNTGTIPGAPGQAREEIVAVPVRHPERWVAVAVIAVLAAMLTHTLVTNPRFQWRVVGQFFGSQAILDGLLRTIELTAVAMALGIVLGVVLAIMRLSPNPVLSRAAWSYIWFFRGTPVLVQIIFWYNLSALFPSLSLGVPFGPALVSGSANSIITPFVAAILGLGLAEAAYMAEIVRAGILSVDRGQHHAAAALGMGRMLVMRRIVLPQAMRLIIPPTGNETISMLKTTSLVSVISFQELLYSAQLIYARNFETIPLLLVASLWYLAATTVLSGFQTLLERRAGRGWSAQASTPGGLRRMFLGSGTVQA
jgi:polar amino acid transport system permease protein